MIHTLVCAVIFLCLSKAERSAPPSELRQGQFYPTHNTADPMASQTTACGPIRDVIKRNSARFRRVLVHNGNADVKFASDDARYMTSRAKSKLDVLVSRAFIEFGSDFQIQVVKAWTDNINRNNLLSLHYEGRALLLRFANGDRDKLGKLASLAARVGFDWVFYNNPIFITVSVIPDVCQTNLDMAVVIDTSGSVGQSNVIKIQDFIRKLIDFFNIGKNETHVALISYSLEVYKVFGLLDHTTKVDMKKAVSQLIYEGSLTATGDALHVMRTWAFGSGNGVRNDKSIPKVGILVTDGYSNYGKSVYHAASEVHRDGINMFAIGVRYNLRLSELDAIASDPDSNHVFMLDDFTDLTGFVERLSTVSCDEGAVVSKCDSAETTVEEGSFKYFRAQFTSDAAKVTIEVQDKKGKSYLYTSLNNKNPGPLEPDAIKATDSLSPRAVTVDMTSSASKLLYIAVQGQEAVNTFLLVIWDSLFEKDMYETELVENSASDQPVITTISKSTGYEFTYSISHGNEDGAFKISPDKGIITTTRSLDREIKAAYSLIVIAQDKNQECHKGRTQVIVKVKDQNDNKPTFVNADQPLYVREDTPIKQLVFTVKATDADEGKNKEVRYRIDNTDGNRFFQIETERGEIRLKSALDFETQRDIELKVTAYDLGTPSQSAQAVLQISVQDVNESPEFKTECTKSGKGPCMAQLNENLPKNTKVFHFQATDPDTQQNCLLRFRISSSDGRYFRIDERDGSILTDLELDREFRSSYLLKVEVRDCAVPPLSSSSYLTVNVLDVNDNAPVFSASMYTSSLSENRKRGTAIAQVVVSDSDEGVNAELEYEIVTGSLPLPLSITEYGWIKSTEVLDRERVEVYNVTVRVKDRGIPVQSSMTHMIITVDDVNDNAPFFVGNLSYFVKENSNVGTVIGKLLFKDIDKDLNSQVRCTILDNDVGGIMDIDPTNCILTVKGVIDREQRSDYNITIQASDLGNPTLSSNHWVLVEVLDENDNDPKFVKGSYTFNVKENAVMDTHIGQVSATDADLGVNQAVSYSILSGNPRPRKFDINSTTGVISLVGKLDYGTQNRYDLIVMAQDAGVPQRKGAIVVTVAVEDTNDFRPKFMQASYSVIVPEDKTLGSSLTTVTAQDQDSGPSGELTYSIADGNADGIFRMEGRTGTISLYQQLDYEKTRLHNFSVVVVDNGKPSFSDSAIVIVSVEDVNDNQPLFKMNPYEFSVAENQSSGFVLGQLEAIDQDSGANGLLDFSLVTSGAPFSCDKQGQITLNGKVDYETVTIYTLEAEVRDSGVPQLNSKGKIVVRVVDSNDNDPVFEFAQCGILENAKTGTHVCFIKATDADSGKNGEVSYTITTAAVPFVIDSRSGAVLVTKSLDREAQASYNVEIRAEDAGTPPRSSRDVVLITVKDENDNVPKFNSTGYTFQVTEGVPINSPVGVVTAQDLDVGSNGEISYTIASGNIDNRFSINESSGLLSTRSAIDRETLDAYALMVTAKDHGIPPLSAQTTIRISVEDINDNSPTFTATSYIGTVREDAAIGANVAQVSAVDVDAGKNGQVAYSLTNAGDQAVFKIDRDLGLITTAATLDYETVKEYNITVRATDGGIPVKASTVKVTIKVLNVDDNAPEFGTVDSVRIYEGAQPGSPVVKFNAKDKDGGVLTYSILEGNIGQAFSVDPSSGDLKVAKVLDRETRDFYNLTVAVTDESGKRTTANLPIYVLDVNDNEPIFQGTPYQGSVLENSRAGILVFTVKATDLDFGSNKLISYAIVSGNQGDNFAINETTGKLQTIKSIDRETYPSFNLVITATDHGSPALHSTVIVPVDILDENDNTPSFVRKGFTVPITENNKEQAILTTLRATDNDIGENGRISYSLLTFDGKVSEIFLVDNQTGVIVVTQRLDREQRDLYRLLLTASDGGTPMRQATVPINVTILDENDEVPVIREPAHLSPVNESVPIGFVITIFKGTDRDLGLNAELRFTIVSGNTGNAFSLDAKSGIFTVASSLDREVLSLYQLTIQIEDLGTPKLKSAKDYVISVADSNDNCPSFVDNEYKATVPEDISIGSSVMQISAMDADLGGSTVLSYAVDTRGRQMPFSCDAKSGIITSNAALDFETTAAYQFDCTVFDGVCRSVTPCIIYIRNINDNAPIFANRSYTVHVAENSNSITSLLTVQATDKDDFGRIVYDIAPTSSEFSIDSQTGEVKTKVTLDRETTDKYEIRITATDGGQPAMFTNVNVSIIVDDINDNAPKFAKDGDTRTVQENGKAGNIILALVATDADDGVNKEIVYEIVKSSESSNFVVDSKTGKVTTAVSFDRESKSTYTVSFVAKDMGQPQLASKPFVLNVNIGDENDNSPTFQPISKVQLIENKEFGSSVIRVMATDLDAGRNSEISYGISAGNSGGSFRMDEKNGVLVVNGSLDRETVETYNLTITATDGGIEPMVGFTFVFIDLQDVNDNSPRFIASSANLSVAENKKIGYQVGTVLAVDLDLGNNGRVKYSSEASDKFEIDSLTGELKTLQVLDREEKDYYELLVTATDYGNPPLSSSLSIRIQVIDEDDNCPVFTPLLYNVTIQERLAFGTTILTVHATDLDIGSNAIVKYAIREGDDRGAFNVNPNTGDVIVAGEVDREFSAVYHLRIRAGELECGLKDTNETNVGEGGSKEKLNITLADVYIHVTDINDNAPAFGADAYNITFLRSDQTTLLNVTALDPDSGDGGKVKFRLLETRRVSIGNKGAQSVTVEAYDLGIPSRKANTTVLVINELPCGAMAFDLSEGGTLSVTTLCGFTDLPEKKRLLKGQVLKLNCAASGNSPRKYRWLKDGSALTSYMNKGEMVIQEVKQSDEGEYACVAYNAAGSIQSNTAFIEVLEIPMVVNFDSEVTVATDNDVTLPLVATGDPEPTFQWYKNGLPFHEGRKGDKGSLTLSRAIKEDSGEYFCEAKNAVGLARSGIVTLQVFDKTYVLGLEVNISNPNSEGKCNYFIPKKFKSLLESIVNTRVAITKVGRSDFCNVTACEPNPCLNQGRCELVPSGYYCTCRREWKGKNCQIDVDECAAGDKICSSKGKCNNVAGNFKCDCSIGFEGRQCQHVTTVCNAAKCNGTDVCVLTSQNDYPTGWACIPQNQEFSVSIELKSVVSWEPYMVYKLEDNLNEIIKTLPQLSPSFRGRRSGPVTQVEYFSCSLQILKHSYQGNGKLQASFVMVCPKNLQGSVRENWAYFCGGILANHPAAKTCSVSGEDVLHPPSKPFPPSSRFRIEIVFVDTLTNATLGVAESKALLKRSDVAARLAEEGILLEGYSQAYMEVKSKSQNINLGAIAGGIAGAILCCLILAIVAVVRRRRRRKSMKGNQAFAMVERVRERRISKEDLLQTDLTMGVVGIVNTGFRMKTEDNDYFVGNDLFMCEGIGNLAKAARKEVERFPWFAGRITADEAEKLLLACDEAGRYLVYETLEDQLMLAVLVSPGVKRVKHLLMEMSPSKEFTIRVGSTSPCHGKSVMDIIAHYRETPMQFDSTAPSVLLTEPWQ